MPRHYSLGKRAASVAETRRRVIEAAADLYQEQGITATSMQDVARRADVAPGTVLHHFPTPDVLTEAVIAQLMVDLGEPSPGMFDGLSTIRDRVGSLVRELAAFYHRSEPWYQMSLREGGRSKVLNDAEVQFYQRLEALLLAALGPLADDATALAALSAFANPSVIGGLMMRGMSLPEAADLVTDVLVPWLEGKAGTA